MSRGFLAVDPGLTGALVILNEHGKYIDHLFMPSIKVGSKNRVNPAAIVAWLEKWPGLTHAYVENVHSMPSDGASRAFSFGHSAGVIHGVIAGIGVPITPITPQSWKKHHNLLGTDKDAARSRATQLFPDLRILDTKAKGQAIADALFIGLFGIHKFTQSTPKVA